MAVRYAPIIMIAEKMVGRKFITLIVTISKFEIKKKLSILKNVTPAKRLVRHSLGEGGSACRGLP